MSTNKGTGFETKNGGAPAMPVVGHKDSANQCLQGQLFHGLTKREHFAAMAIQGLATKGSPRNIAAEAVLLADVLLAALEES